MLKLPPTALNFPCSFLYPHSLAGPALATKTNKSIQPSPNIAFPYFWLIQTWKAPEIQLSLNFGNSWACFSGPRGVGNIWLSSWILFPNGCFCAFSVSGCCSDWVCMLTWVSLAWVGILESVLSSGNQAQHCAVYPFLKPEPKVICVIAVWKLFSYFHWIQAVFAFRVTNIVQLHKGPDLSKGTPLMKIRHNN